MAKGARASTLKANNARLKSKVFGPVEAARNARLSAKLMELASQPKPKKEEVLLDTDKAISTDEPILLDAEQAEDMEVDPITTKRPASSKSAGRSRIEKKRSSRKASIVFSKYKKGSRVSKSKGKK